ncbi:CapA family protein [Candidatus Saccharibacteria bacterium]|nr:CapA family protein [Candidatus Saccharibacteria bacterium]
MGTIGDKLSRNLQNQNSQLSKKYHKFSPRSLVKLILFCTVIVAVVVFLAMYFLRGHLASVTEPATPSPTPVEPPREPVATRATAKYLFAGTTFWGRRTNTDARASTLGVEYPFSELTSLDSASYDAWIAGLECPITDKGHNSYEENTLLKFNCDPDYLPIAKKYFTAFGLGSNHTGNHGVDGLAETRRHLSSHGIQYFGTPKRTASDTQEQDEQGIDNCSVLVLPIQLTYDDQTTQSRHFPFGFCSAHGVYGLPGADYQENIKVYAAVLPTIVMPHMGAEYKASNDEMRQTLYRSMIDNGVEAVIADHPHWIQNTEAYKGRLIAYSIGNFMFDQTFNKEVSRSAAIEARPTVQLSDNVDLDAWLKLADQCLKRFQSSTETTLSTPSCFETIKNAKLTRPVLSWEYAFHGTTSATTRIPRLASEAEQAEIGQRLNWQATMNALRAE